MRHRYGKWYADWRDEHGQRRMKAFPSKSKALRYQEQQRRQVAAKKAPRRQARRRESSKPTPKPTANA